MELLLNICWVLLIGPALYVWLGRSRSGKERRCLTALVCLLVLLFPVISASDDLHVIRQEIEDSTISKRTMKQCGNDKAAAQNPFSSPPCLVTSAVLIEPFPDPVGFVGTFFLPAVSSDAVPLNLSRAPPAFLISLM